MTRKDVSLDDAPCDAGLTRLDLTLEDIADAVRSVPGYLDVSMADLLVVYRLAQQFALRRASGNPGAAGRPLRPARAARP